MSVHSQIGGHNKDLGGGFVVRRLLPSGRLPAVGPFVFFDHFGPVLESPEQPRDVRPHPHIGLATVTYLFEGAIMHRDSAGYAQQIEPGAINWMTAGRGIVHSERKPESLRQAHYRNHGLQLWAALPQAFEEVEPAFSHTPAADIPERQVGAARVRVLVGEAFGARSPVATFSRTLYLDVALPDGARLALPALEAQQAVYVVEGALQVDGEAVAAQRMALLTSGETSWLVAQGDTRLVVIGGEPLDGRRLIWWNFVSSRKERILEAAAAWKAQTLGQVPGETEFIPLPDTPLPPA